MANTKAKVVEEVVEEITEKKEAVNVLDLLLGSDAGEIKLPTKQIEIKRLSEHYGAPFIVTCTALAPDKYEEVQDMALDIQGKDVDLDINLLKLITVMEGVLDANGKYLFKNAELMKKHKAPTPKELVKKILLSGEINSLYTIIADLSGFGDNAIEEVKN
jgi:hypothetical protein